MAEPVVALPRPLPVSVQLSLSMALTPNEMRILKEKTGRPLNELLGGDFDDLDTAPDRIQSLIWAQLRRDGYDVSWEQAGDVLPDYVQAEPDPTSAESSSSSSTSAASGG
jgi:hypothetical protein